MLWLFVCLTTAGAFGAGMAWAQLRLKAADPVPPRLPPRAENPMLPAAAPSDVMDELFALKTGDVVCHLGVDHVVGRVLRFEGEGVTMMRAMVDGEPGTSILVVGGPQPLPALCRPTRIQTPMREPPDMVEHNGLRYRRFKRMDLRDKAHGGAATHIHLHEGPDGMYLFFIQGMGTMETLEGRRMLLADVMVLRS